MRVLSPALLAAGLLLALPLEAYVGPGAGFAFVGSLFSLIAALVSGALAFLMAESTRNEEGGANG